MAKCMMASAAAEKIRELVAEFGDFELMMPDQLESKWLKDVTDVKFDPAMEVITVVSED